MASESELRREIADERRELTNAVAELRTEIEQTAERGKKLGIKVSAATAVAVLTRIAVRLRKR
jgi:uncharacterized protein YdhG (YjbR/CyaY superfamily)